VLLVLSRHLDRPLVRQEDIRRLFALVTVLNPLVVGAPKMIDVTDNQENQIENGATDQPAGQRRR